MRLVKGLFILLCAFLVFPVPLAKAGEVRRMTYDVYAGGIHAMDATLIIEKSTNSYTLKLSAATQGLLGSLAPWSGEFFSNGVIGAKGMIYPKIHTSKSVWKKKVETKTFTYDGKGHFKSYKVMEGDTDKTPDSLDKELTIGSTDVLSATFHMMQNLPQKNTCAGSDLIFDGDRNFTFAFHDPQPDPLKKNDYNVYDGSSVSCVAEVTPKGGKWRKKPRGWLSIQEQGRQKGGLPTVWFGQPDIKAVKEGVTAAYVPVKIRVKTNYGILFMHLTSYSVTGAKTKAKP